MRIFAYCARSFADQTRRAAGIDPVTCPPAQSGTLDLTQLENCDLLYLDLHGIQGAAHWEGDGRTVALTAEELGAVDLTGTVVFATNCYLGDAHSPMLGALLRAGSTAVIAGPGKNWSPQSGVAYGAALLGMWVRLSLQMGATPETALEIAKLRVRASRPLNRGVAADTLEFRIYRA